MDKNYPLKGHLVSVMIDPEKPSKKAFMAIIRDVKTDGTLVVPLPDNVDEKAIRPGHAIVMEYELNSALFKYHSHIEYVEAGGAVGQTPLLLVSPQFVPEKIQRRKYFRLRIALPMRFLKVHIPDIYETDAETQRRAHMKWNEDLESRGFKSHIFDISGGGLGFESDTPFAVESTYFFEIRLGEEIFSAAGVIVYCQKNKVNSEKKFMVGVRFVGLPESAHDRLVGYVFRVHTQMYRQSQGEKK